MKSKKDKSILTLYIEKLKTSAPPRDVKKGSQRNPAPLNNKLEVN